MTYLELIRDAEHKLESNEITLGEYNELIEPLRRELEQEPNTDILDKIIAEIDKKISHYDHFSSSNTANGLTMAKEIVEKYRQEG